LHVVFVVDPQVLPADEWSELQAFAGRQAYPILRSRDELENYRAGHPVDLLYWLCHADPSALVLSGSKIDAVDLYRVCQRLFHRQSRGLVVLNACQTAEEGREGSFMEALHDAGLSGMVATEERTVNVFAHRFGLGFLQAFLIDGEAIGPALQKLRAGGHPQTPLGLLYGTYCPPHIRARRPTLAPPSSVPLPAAPANAPPPEASAGAFLGPQAEAGLPPLPEHPYRSLAYYDREHRALFAGRDADVQRFALLLDEADSRILVLHGQSGVGKSSFLRAGLIPFLEEDCIGYQFLRDRQEGRDEPILFIRATSDPAGPLAKALCDFCARGEKYATPRADKAPVEVDLPGILSRLLQGVPGPAALRGALRADTSLLGRLLAALAERLPYTLVLVIDQGEEVFTLARTRQDEDSRHLALEMLRRALEVRGRFKVIVSLRTEYYGRVLDALRQDVRSAAAVRDYLLTDLQEGELAEAILRPTATAPIPHASEVPAQKYRFRYEPGVAETISQEVRDYCRGKQDSELPLAQIICTQLYERASRRPEAVISRQDVEQIGGVEGGLRKHVEALLADLLPHPRDRRAFKQLFGRLYRRQPDRLVTTELVLEQELARQWTGGMAFDRMLEITSRSDRNLLRVKTLPGEQGERRYVSLGHDALAKVAADWDEEHNRGARIRKKVLVLGGIILAACLVLTAAVAVIGQVRLASAFAQEQKAKEDAVTARHDAEVSRSKAVAAERRASVALYSKRISEAYRNCFDSNFFEAEELLDLCKTETPTHCLWEWRYLERWCHSRLLTLKGGKPVASMAFSPDAKHLAAGDKDGLVRVWEVANPAREPLALPAGKETVFSVAFSPDGRRLAAGGRDGYVRVWEVANPAREPLALPAGKQTVFDVAFSSKGGRLAAGGADGYVRVWEVADLTREPLAFPAGQETISRVTFSPDGERLAAGGKDGFVRVFEVSNPAKAPLAFPAGMKTVFSVAFSPDGRRLAAVGKDGFVRVWEVANPAKDPLAFPAGKETVWCVAFSLDGGRLAAGCVDGVVRVWEVAHLGKEPLSFARVWEGFVRVWEVANPAKDPLAFPAAKETVWCVAFSLDGRRLAACFVDGVVRVWEVAHLGKEPLALRTGEMPVCTVAFSPDSRRLAAGGRDGFVLVWEVADLAREPLALPAGKQEICNVTFSQDGRRLAAGGRDGFVRVWEVADLAREPLALPAGKKTIRSIAFSSKGGRFAAGSADGFVRVWEVADPAREPLALPTGKMPVFNVAFSPDGERLAACGSRRAEPITGRVGDARETPLAGGDFGFVLVWEVADLAREPLALPTGKMPFCNVAFSPDGARLAAGCLGVVVRVWDILGGQEILALGQEVLPLEGFSQRRDSAENGLRMSYASFLLDDYRLAVGSVAGAQFLAGSFVVFYKLSVDE
jgi:WD40 repeat protein